MLVKKNPAYELLRLSFLLSIVFPFLVLLILSFSERYTWPGILPGNYSLRAIRSILFQRKALFYNALFSIFFSVLVSFCTLLVAYCTAKWQSEHKESSLLSFFIFLFFFRKFWSSLPLGKYYGKGTQCFSLSGTAKRLYESSDGTKL